MTDIPIPGLSAGGVAIEWNGDGWGVLYSSIVTGTAFQELDYDGRRVGVLRRYDPSGVRARLVWADGRFAAAVGAEGSQPLDMVFALLDRRGVMDAGWTALELPGAGAEIARVSNNDRWIVLHSENGLSRIDAREMSSRAEIVNRLTFGPRSNEPALPVGLKSRVVVFHRGPENDLATTLTVPLATAESTPFELPEGSGLRVATRLRDRAVALGSERGAHTFVSYDPFVDDMLVHRAAFPTTPLRHIHDAIGVHTPGVVAACYSVGDPDSTIELRVFGADGIEAGEARPISSVPDPAGEFGCAVGSDGERIFVAWQVTGEQLIRVRGYRLRR